MTTSEKVKWHINELKKCPPDKVSLHAMEVLESWIFLEKTETLALADALYKWAEPKAKHNPPLFAYAKALLAHTYFNNEQYDEAFPLLTEVQNLFTEQNDVCGAAICLTMQGSMYRTFGNFDLALKSLWQSHEQLKNAEATRHFLLAAKITIAGIYIEMKHYDEAIPLLKSALEITEGTRWFYWTIYALHGLGKIALIEKKYEVAKEYFEKAMVVAEKNNHPVSVCNSLSELGNYYFAANDYVKAEQFHKRALALREQNNFIGGAITSCMRLGEIYMAQAKPDEAIEIFNKGLKLAEQLKVKLKMYQIHFLLSEIYQGKNELEKSFAHYRQFHELREQVELEDSARKLKNAQLVFAAEQTRKENIIIKKQKQEIEKKNIELQDTIDELTRAKIGRKAKAITLFIAIVLFILEDTILHFALILVPSENYFISLVVKMVIIFSLNPINKAVESYLLSKVIKKKKREVVMVEDESLALSQESIN